MPLYRCTSLVVSIPPNSRMIHCDMSYPWNFWASPVITSRTNVPAFSQCSTILPGPNLLIYSLFAVYMDTSLSLSVYSIPPEMEHDLQQQADDHERYEYLVAEIDQIDHGRLLDVGLIMRDPAVREVCRCICMAFLAALQQVLFDGSCALVPYL